MPFTTFSHQVITDEILSLESWGQLVGKGRKKFTGKIGTSESLQVHHDYSFRAPDWLLIIVNTSLYL